MLRWESTANGEANFDEYDSIKTEKGFKAL